MPYIQRKAALQESDKVTLSSGLRMAYYIDCDDGPPGSDPPLTVFAIHGMSCGKEMWLLPKTTAGVKLVAIDRLGHGDSDGEPDDYGYAEIVRDLFLNLRVGF